MNKTHCLTAALAVLLAAPTAVATQTANAQTVQEAAKANAEKEIILSEDFSKMTSGSESNPDLSFNINTCTGMPSNDIFYSCVNPDYTQTPGWGSYQVYPAGGMIYFNNTRADDYYAAHFNTPVFDASADNGIYFVSFRARLINNAPDYAGLGYTTQDVTDPKTPVYTEYGNVKDMTSEWKEFTLRFEKGKKATRVIFREEDGVKVLLDQKLLLRSDGTSVYMTQDIGTAEMRFNDFPIDKMIYVVGNEQNYHFQVLSILLDRLGFKWGKELVHFSYGMVELPNGKMKSREGTVVDADDLIAAMVADAKQTSEELGKFKDMSEEERNEIARIVGLGALKYFILKVDARKNMLFNPEESIDFNGNTGPFIQYTYARIRSILRKAQAEGINIPATLADTMPLNEKEIELIQKLNEFGAAVEQAGKDYSPSGIANYCYELTKAFNQFYHDYSILGADTEEEKVVRLVLAQNVGKTLKNGMALLGIEVPERM